jgi:hypothetical protein
MAKRFTDTAKWKKEFIKGLSAKHKLLWFYILDDCDHAGIWEVDFEVASLRIGEDVSYDEAFAALGQQLEVIGKNRWWIKDFISFQYGALTEKNKMYKPIMTVLQKFNINPNIPHSMEHISPIDGVKVKDKDKDKVEEKVNGGVGEISGSGFRYELAETPTAETVVPREAQQLTENILDYFAASKDVMSPIFSKVDNFISMIFHRGELPQLLTSFEKYKAYKARSQEQVHGIEKWIGTVDKFYKDGHWYQTDWELKLKNYEQQGIKGTSRTTGTQNVGGTQYGTNGGF